MNTSSYCDFCFGGSGSLSLIAFSIMLSNIIICFCNIFRKKHIDPNARAAGIRDRTVLCIKHCCASRSSAGGEAKLVERAAYKAPQEHDNVLWWRRFNFPITPSLLTPTWGPITIRAFPDSGI